MTEENTSQKSRLKKIDVMMITRLKVSCLS